MIGFWLAVVLLLALALAFLLPVLWRPRPPGDGSNAAGVNVAVYRDQLKEAERDLAADLITRERYEQLRTETQRRVLDDVPDTATTAAAGAPAATAQVARPSRRLALSLALLLPLASVATYLSLGRPDATQVAAVAAAATDHQVSPEQIEAMVTALADRLKADPANAEGWQMLGRSYSALGRYTDAAAALRQVVQLLPGQADPLADLADVLGMAQGRNLAGEPARLVEQALAIDPRHVKALALAGSVAFEAGEFARARDLWLRLVEQVPPESEIGRAVQGSIEEATRLAAAAAAGPGAAASAPASTGRPASAPATAATASISGEVSLSPELAGRVAAGDTVYVFARAAEGPRLPLAIVKQAAGSWPLRFTLDDSTAMSPDARLSSATSVVVVARVSRSGNATPQPGDLVGQTAPLSPGSAPVRLVIDRVQP